MYLFLLIHPISISFFTLFFSTFLDFICCSSTLINLIQQKPHLYIKGIQANYLNLFLIAPANYMAISPILHLHEFSFLNYMLLLFVHGIGYYGFHFIMHRSPYLKWIHQFHHQFVITVPSAANAVSICEFQFAYMTPFLMGAICTYPSIWEFDAAIFTVSFFNILIHVQELRFVRVPVFLVSPFQHTEHHRRQKNRCYSAPIFNFDFLYNYYNGEAENRKKEKENENEEKSY